MSLSIHGLGAALVQTFEKCAAPEPRRAGAIHGHVAVTFEQLIIPEIFD